jgi:hypothetical protein
MGETRKIAAILVADNHLGEGDAVRGREASLLWIDFRDLGKWPAAFEERAGFAADLQVPWRAALGATWYALTLGRARLSLTITSGTGIRLPRGA